MGVETALSLINTLVEAEDFVGTNSLRIFQKPFGSDLQVDSKVV